MSKPNCEDAALELVDVGRALGALYCLTCPGDDAPTRAELTALFGLLFEGARSRIAAVEAAVEHTA